MSLKDVPGDDEPPADQPDLIIHAAIMIGDDVLMGSDDVGPDGPSTDFGPVQGMMVSYDAASVDDANRVFDALADGGSVSQELIPTFFSEAFGMCTDRFGTPWMVVAPEPTQPG